MVPMAVNRPPQPARRTRELAVGCVEVGGKAPVAIDQEAVQAENLHFLGGFDARGGMPDIVELAPFRRADVVERIALRVEMRLAEERRHQSEKQQEDQPRRVQDQAGGEARHGHHVLRLAEQLAHQRHPPAGLAAGALELVLELGVFEILEVESRRVLHQAHARSVGSRVPKGGCRRERRRGREHRRARPARIRRAAGSPAS